MTKTSPTLAGKAKPDDLLTIHEAAALVRSSTWTLAGWRKRGKGPPFVQFGKHGPVFYRRNDLERWVNEHRTAPNGSGCAP